MQQRFENKLAIVTGAASGLGRAVSIRLASEGATVRGLDLNGDGLNETAALVEEAGGTMTGQTIDVSDPQACKDGIEEAVAVLGGLDVLANVAGVIKANHIGDVSAAEWRLMFAVNVDGPFFLSQAALPHLLERRGNIVNIASNAGLMGQAYTVGYCASKGAIIQMTKAMAMELAKQPIRVNAVAPGGINTPLVANYEMPEEVDFALMAPYTGFRAMSEPESIAAAVAFVASDEASSVHGSIFSVDSGLTAS